MSLAEDVFAALTGGTPAARAYPEVLPQMPVLPALTYRLIAGTDDFHLQGRSGLVIRLVQVDAWATTRMGADRAMADASVLMVASQAFQVNGIDVSGADTYEEETQRYRASREFSIWVQE